ncbi:MAG: nicotinate (nicotinamide) nucleotide adenylyltransferase, partial [Gammaproteobacteria bacterium]
MGDRIGIFGGTFDPVHCGHLRAMVELRDELALNEVRVVPCGVPPHRAEPRASAQARLAMLDVALADLPGFSVDRRELERPGPSYMVDTLVSMRADWPEAALWLLLGHDAFCTLPQWRRWRELFSLANVGVARRPGASVEAG